MRFRLVDWLIGVLGSGVVVCGLYTSYDFKSRLGVDVVNCYALSLDYNGGEDINLLCDYRSV